MNNNKFVNSEIDITTLTKYSSECQNKLLEKMNNMFTETQQKLFIESFYKYLNYNSKTDFVINLDDVWKWCGFTRKDNCKRLLERHFTKDIDYKLIFLRSEEKSERGRPVEDILLNIESFKLLCMLAGTDKSKEIRQYYLKLEEILQETVNEDLNELKNKLLEKEQKELELQSQLEKNKEQLEQKELELKSYKEKKYEEIEKHSHVYVIKTDGGYKIGKTKDLNSRVKGLQTGNVTDIKVMLDFKTSNSDLLERLVHYTLDRYRCNSNREFFDCNIDHITNVVNIMGNTIDTLKSSYQSISKTELFNKLNDKLETNFRNYDNYVNVEYPPTYDKDFETWLDEHIELKTNKILRLRDICEQYLSRNTNQIASKISSVYKFKVEKYLQKKYPLMNSVYHKYKDSTFNNIKYKGWLGFNLK